MRSQSKFSPRLESLDDRSLMSVTLSNGLLTVVGTTGADQIRVTLASPTVLQVTVDTTGDIRQFNLSAVNSILVRALAGNDFVLIGPNIKIHAEVHGGLGNDTIFGGGETISCSARAVTTTFRVAVATTRYSEGLETITWLAG